MHLNVKVAAAAASLAAVLALPACGKLSIPDPMGAVNRATGRAADSAADTAGKSVGDRFGNAAAARIGGTMTPMLTQFYMQFVFAMAFHQGGYAVNEVPYAAGEWTRWSIPNPGAEGDEPKETTLERAFLFTDKDQNAWWKVKWVVDPAKASESTLVVEALFDPRTNNLLRMRARMPNETEGKEIPVTEATYYVPPQRLTKQSLEGATKGIVPVTVPAGSFKARHVVFGDAAGGTAEWFLVDKIPGGNVKFVHQAKGGDPDGDPDPQNYVMNLTGFGKGAKSELGITP